MVVMLATEQDQAFVVDWPRKYSRIQALKKDG